MALLNIIIVSKLYYLFNDYFLIFINKFYSLNEVSYFILLDNRIIMAKKFHFCLIK